MKATYHNATTRQRDIINTVIATPSRNGMGALLSASVDIEKVSKDNGEYMEARPRKNSLTVTGVNGKIATIRCT